MITTKKIYTQVVVYELTKGELAIIIFKDQLMSPDTKVYELKEGEEPETDSFTIKDKKLLDVIFKNNNKKEIVYGNTPKKQQELKEFIGRCVELAKENLIRNIRKSPLRQEYLKGVIDQWFEFYGPLVDLYNSLTGK